MKGFWVHIRSLFFAPLLGAMLLSTIATAQTTQPAGRFDNQLVRAESSSSDSTAAPATAPASMQIAPVKFDWPRVALALGTVIAVIFAMKFIARRWLGVSSVVGAGQVIRVLGRATTAPRQQVVLIQVGRRIVVAADNGGQMNALCQITEADEVAQLLGQLEEANQSTPTSTFRRWLKKADDDFAADEMETQPAVASAAAVGRTEANPTLDHARGEIAGLMDKVRDLARQYKK
jgi:flagellar biogenesis protein FliO